mmetsp:Transcript_28797/g.72466  ORF Transcript_28797/g.72466 Transcript_28797/m.72466 type:complete len:196 (-) Transcript_28797:93-680(-)|eukprot:CAMPEP_0177661020 /NCGR_PEP_ID=MMETSP0447-20121125/18404_1 /TAXON_ID=0 /ORGANISM="Stygamoeba regulata, Strain BSH-02190019" /LENGTH=195 /DNA_ID=CAMNT_0019166231 /DNA_START=83 /DNA_END=670 /DNA_ORIENTATION=+
MPATPTGAGAVAPPVPVNVFDHAAVKVALDDEVIKELVGQGHEQDNTHSNIRIVCGVVCCAAAVLAHFYPVPWPESRPAVAVCCLVFLLSNAALQWLAWAHGNTVLTTCASPPRRRTFGAPVPARLPKPTPLIVRSWLPRFDHMYKLEIANRDEPGVSASASASITTWFSLDGHLDKPAFARFVRSLSDRLSKSS